jgi:hypothetical protein
MSDEEVKQEVKIAKKPNGNKKVIPELLEVVKEEETISYSKANELTKKKRVLSDKQKENVLKLIASNKEKREAKQKQEAQALAEAKEAEEASKKLEEAKAKVKLVRVLPKRVNKKKVVIQEEEEDDESDDEPMPMPIKYEEKEESDADTTDTRVLKKKIKKLDMMNKIQKATPTKKVESYERSILKNSGFITF